MATKSKGKGPRVSTTTPGRGSSRPRTSSAPTPRRGTSVNRASSLRSPTRPRVPARERPVESPTTGNPGSSMARRIGESYASHSLRMFQTGARRSSSDSAEFRTDPNRRIARQRLGQVSDNHEGRPVNRGNPNYSNRRGGR